MAQPKTQSAVPLTRVILPHRSGQGFALTCHHDEPLAARDPSVEEIALEKEEVLHGQRDDHRGEF